MERREARRTRQVGRRFRDCLSFAAILIAALALVVPLTGSVPSGAVTVSACTPGALDVTVDPGDPGNANSAVFLQDNVSGSCSLSGQPTIRVFDQFGHAIKSSESLYHWNTPLARPVAPIIVTPNVSAVVEFTWCGFGGGNKRFDIDFAASHRTFVVRSVTEGPAQEFVPPACSNGSTAHLAVDYVREMGPKGIVGLSHTVRVTPSVALHSGEKVRVSVSGFWPSGKFWISECSAAEYRRTKALCGGQLAAEPFGMADYTGSGSYEFTVQSRARRNLKDSPTVTCERQCVLVVTSGDGLTAYAHLSFAQG